MASKPQNQGERRTPLSLTGMAKQNLNNKNVQATGGHNVNNSSIKQQSVIQQSNESKDNSQKELKKQQQQQQQQQLLVDKKISDEKKSSQNGVGKNAATAKEKQQMQQNQQAHQPSGSNGHANARDNKDKNLEKSDKPPKVDKIEKSSNQISENLTNKKELEKKTIDKKEKVSEKKDPERKLEIKLKKSDSKASTPIEQNRSEIVESRPQTAVDKLAEKSKSDTPTKSGSPIQTKNPIKSRNSPSVKTAKEAAPVSPEKLNIPVQKADCNKKTPTKNQITAIDGYEEMETLSIDASPVKSNARDAILVVKTTPTATSTPGKLTDKRSVILKTEVPSITELNKSPSESISLVRTYSQISCRRGIRPLAEYTPMRFQSNLQSRESYRRINTELDVSSTTNTSMNVTVGSEVPNNSSFSFFGRGRKRDRTPPHSQSTIELQSDAPFSPPKRARLDFHSFFSVVSSPLTLLRSKFAKASIESSTVKIDGSEDEGEVQNVSGLSIEEEIPYDECTDNETIAEKGDANKEMDKIEPSGEANDNENVEPKKCDIQNAHTTAMDSESDVNIAETLEFAGEEPLAKNKKCHIM